MRTPVVVVLASIALVATAGGASGADAEPTFQGTIAYTVHSNKSAWIEALDLASGTVTRLAAAVPAANEWQQLAWSPNGRELAFSTIAPGGYAKSVSVVDFATKRVWNLTASLPAGVVGFRWSPDGRSIAIAVDSRLGTSASGIYLVQPGAPGARRLYHVRGRMSAWSPTGAKLAIVDDSGQHAEGCSKQTRIVIKAIAGGNRTEIRAHPARAKARYEVSTVSWRPSGGALLYTTNDTDSLAPGNPRTECYPSDSTGAAAFIVDSRRTTTRLLTTSSGTIPRAAWSPDGRRIVIHHLIGHVNDSSSISMLRVLDLETPSKRTLVSDFRGEFAWTRSGKLIEASSNEVLLRDTTSGRARVLARWRDLSESWAHIFAVGKDAVAVHAGNDVVHRVALAQLTGGGSKLITLEPQSREYRIGDVAVTLA